MALVLTFRSTSFDVTAEPPNPVNPIFGESALEWLGAKLKEGGYAVTEPSTEDWGWYIDAGRDAVHYLVGASAEPEGAGPVAWTVQIEKHRTLKDKLTGRNRLAPDDGLCALVEKLLREDPGTSNLEVQREEPGGAGASAPRRGSR